LNCPQGNFLQQSEAREERRTGIWGFFVGEISEAWAREEQRRAREFGGFSLVKSVKRGQERSKEKHRNLGVFS